MATRGTESSRASAIAVRQIGGARPGCGQAHGGLAGDAGHALGDEPRALFMAREDVTDRAAVQCVVERQDGPAGDACDGADALPFEQGPQEVGAGDFHGGSRCEPAPLARSGGGKKKPPPVRHRRGQSLMDDQNPRGARMSATTTTTTRARPRDESVVVPEGFMSEPRERAKKYRCQGRNPSSTAANR